MMNDKFAERLHALIKDKSERKKLLDGFLPLGGRRLSDDEEMKEEQPSRLNNSDMEYSRVEEEKKGQREKYL